MFNADDENEYFDEEEFIKNYLSFLLEDDEYYENFNNQSIHVISYEDENSIYGKPSIDSRVSQTWSSISSGSIPSPREVPTKFYNVGLNANLSSKWNDPELGLSFQPDFSFQKDFYQTKTSTPIKQSIKENRRDFGLEGLGTTSYFNQASNGTIPINRTSSVVPPITQLNMLSLVTEKKVPQNVPELKMKTLTNAVPQMKSNSDDKKNACEICSKESGPKSITLADFLKKPDVPPKPQASPKVKQTKHSNFDKENNFCKFCYKNGELMEVFTSHITKTADGTVFCPILRNYVCELCGQTGDNAHTRKYCPLNPERFQRKPLYRRLSNGVLTSSHNHK